MLTGSGMLLTVRVVGWGWEELNTVPGGTLMVLGQLQLF